MKVNAIECLNCGDTIFSRVRHDMRYCSCGEVAIDGGFNYVKMSAKDPGNCIVKKISIGQSRKELAQDYNSGLNKYGLIKKV